MDPRSFPYLLSGSSLPHSCLHPSWQAFVVWCPRWLFSAWETGEARGEGWGKGDWRALKVGLVASLLDGSFLFYKLYFYVLFLAVLGLRCCAQSFSSCSEQGLLFFAGVCWFLIAVASLVAELGL